MLIECKQLVMPLKTYVEWTNRLFSNFVVAICSQRTANTSRIEVNKGTRSNYWIANKLYCSIIELQCKEKEGKAIWSVALDNEMCWNCIRFLVQGEVLVRATLINNFEHVSKVVCIKFVFGFADNQFLLIFGAYILMTNLCN